MEGQFASVANGGPDLPVNPPVTAVEPAPLQRKKMEVVSSSRIFGADFLKKSQMGLYQAVGSERGNVIFSQSHTAALDGDVTSIHGYYDVKWSDLIVLRGDLGVVSDSLQGTTSTTSCSSGNNCSFSSTALSIGLLWHFSLYQTRKFKFGFDAGGHFESPIGGSSNFGTFQSDTINNFTDLSVFSEWYLNPKTIIPFGIKFINSLTPSSSMSFYRMEAFLGYGILF